MDFIVLDKNGDKVFCLEGYCAEAFSTRCLAGCRFSNRQVKRMLMKLDNGLGMFLTNCAAMEA